MNNERRKEIERAIALTQEAASILETARDEEHEAFDNLSVGLQASERGQAIEEAVSALGSAVDSLNEVISNLEGIE